MRDMKYLSKSMNFTEAITDPDILSGVKEGTVAIDLSRLVDSDNSGESRFVVGGRTYFEASVFGYGYHSFTYKGFFDQAGYEEPPSTLRKIRSNMWIWIGAVAAVLAVIGIIVALKYCCNNSSKKVSKNKTD